MILVRRRWSSHRGLGSEACIIARWPVQCAQRRLQASKHLLFLERTSAQVGGTLASRDNFADGTVVHSRLRFQLLRLSGL